ncbi:MAG TPA: ATP-binding cassette domain-containing protein [Ktedonobacteraceae bacterium]|jgi:ABC-2 type transport system ATP-binding protein|nr:ATP-binding cassette domain-containing protein [Ktedonobacteraceae bacterium]
MIQECLTLPSVTFEIRQGTQPVNLLPAIELYYLVKTFGAFRAIDHLSLTVRQGEIFGLLGPNGSGKTTTVNIIAGLLQPTSGMVRIFGHDILESTDQVRRLLGVVPQETSLYEELSAWDNLEFHYDLFGLPAKQKCARISAILELVQLVDRKHSRVGTFSGGMKRRLALGRALLHDPQLLYLDEPTLGVDVQSRNALWTHIRSLRDAGKTILLTTNYLEEAEALCNRLAIIDHGLLIAIDSPEHLRQNYGGSTITITTRPSSLDLTPLKELASVDAAYQNGSQLTIHSRGAEAPVAAIFNILASQCEILDVSFHSASLDEVFLRLTGSALRD